MREHLEADQALTAAKSKLAFCQRTECLSPTAENVDTVKIL